MILDEIVEHKRKEVAACKKRVSRHELEQRLGDVDPPRDLLAALRTPPQTLSHSAIRIPHSKIAIIAECKHASPSRGLIRDPYDPVAIARGYEANGATAISVLTDEKFFGGSLADLKAVRAAVQVPVLRKEFIIDEYQVIEARAAGADAVLLIATVLDAAQLRDLVDVVRATGMHALVEVHAADEIERAAAANTGIIGINNRNLDTLEVDLHQTERLMPLMPSGILVVGESGIHSRDDLAYLRDQGVGAVLIGEHFMSADDPGRALGELISSNG